MTKKPFPVSLDEEIVEWILKRADGTTFRNRSHLVETALKEFKQHLSEQDLKKLKAPIIIESEILLALYPCEKSLHNF